MCAARGVGLDTVAEMVERAEGTVREWLSQWRQARPGSVVTGHAVGGSAARLKRAQKGGAGGDPEETAVGGGRRGRLLGRPGPLRTSRPSSSGVGYRSESS